MLVYFFGYGGNSFLVNKLKPIINDVGFKLVTIHEWPDADVKWERTTWLNELRKADIIVLPANYKQQPAKSNNRLTQALSLGKPTICSPLDSYVRILNETPECCLIADTDEEWRNSLVKLRDDKELREKLSRNALEASKKYSLDVITKKWLNLFKNLEKVDIIIPTYNNHVCLKQCIESIRACTDTLYNIIVVDNGSNEDVQKYLTAQNDLIYIRKSRMTFAQAINTGIKASTSKYVCLLNDDVIVSQSWLKIMLDACKDDVGAVGPLSNCDKMWLHNNSIVIGKINLNPGVHRPHEIGPIIKDIYTYRSPYNDVLERQWIAFYCTLIPKEVITKVGYLDECFSNSGEDVDYCHRIKKFGYKIIQNFNSFVFHYGAVARHIVEKENHAEYHKNDRHNQIYLNEKWNKKTICLYSGASWEKWDHRKLITGIGGSENWQILLAREFSNLGLRVLSFCDCEHEISDDEVKYIPYTKLAEYTDYNWFDYFISSRTTEPFNLNVRTGKKIVMIHDIWLTNIRGPVLNQNQVDKFCVLSEWHKDFVSEHHGISKEKLSITSNGINLEDFDKKVERQPYKLFYSSSLDRGLDTLLHLFDFIKKEIHELELHIFYGLDNWEKAAKNRPSEQQKIEFLKQEMKKEGVFFHGRVGQETLHNEQLTCSLWAYPTDFEETFCITAIEAQAAGIPVVSTNYAGLKTTINNTGILIGSGNKGESYTKQYREQFVDTCIKLLKDKELWYTWSKKGLENSKKYTWENVAKKWVNEILMD